MSFLSLPKALLAFTLLIASSPPVLSTAISSPQRSVNDPFRALVVVHRAQQPEPPVCCLKPLPTVDTLDGPADALLTFEEWKSKKAQTESQGPPTKANAEVTDNDATSKSTVPHFETHPVDTQAPTLYSEDALPPHFRVPITDRFNYANMDCSARVHLSHKSAKQASSILSSKKDKYMLSPCGTKGQFVVVELCDDIRIDTVQLANFEFFSGVFKDFSVSVAKTYTGTNEGWTPAGTYRAKNIRGVQSFHPPTSLRDFYRYIRIDFHSHYGHEYYCPVSLLRVYGLTHLEEWKWDVWEAESRTRLNAERPSAIDGVGPKALTNGDANVSSTQLGSGRTHPNSSLQSTEPVESNMASTSTTQSRKRSAAPKDSTYFSGVTDTKQLSIPTVSSGVTSVTDAISALGSSSFPLSALAVPSPLEAYSQSFDTEAHAIMTSSPPANTPPTPPHVQQPSTHVLQPIQGGGESIYRTIMNRLTLLEANHTLYARYVEEQTSGVRDVLRKLSEEVGRLESITRMQAQMYQRTVHEWERQRLRLELEHGELLSRVNYLSDEVILEKRLGIAQLCLLLAVLVFIGITRGAPSAQQPRATLGRSMREWGVRNLSFGSSADGWNPLRRRSRSATEENVGAKTEKAAGIDVPFTFPLRDPLPRTKTEPSLTTFSLQSPPKLVKPAIPPSSHSHSYSHPQKRSTVPSFFRTPTKPRPSLLIDPHTLPRAEPPVRSHSSSTSGHHNARSAKRWARTAHLHEIKGHRERRGSAGTKRAERYRDRENDVVSEDVFGVLSKSKSKSLSLSTPPNTSSSPTAWTLRRPLAPLGTPRSRTEESVDGDVWIDTDVEGEGEEDGLEYGGGGSERVVVLNSPDAFGRS